jgi:hypothetical protein
VLMCVPPRCVRCADRTVGGQRIRWVTMADQITLVLPVDAEGPAARVLAARPAVLHSLRVGIVDNGLWQSMAGIVRGIERQTSERGATGLRTTPFDHLASDFTAQQAELSPFAGTVQVAVAGLGN